MGFSVTAAHMIFLVAAFGAGGAFATAFVTMSDQVREGYDTSIEQGYDRTITVVAFRDDGSFPDYTGGGTKRWKIQMTNEGPTVLKVDEITYVIEGSFVAAATIEKDEIASSSSSNLFEPGDTLEVWFKPINSEPDRFRATFGNGYELQWVR